MTPERLPTIGILGAGSLGSAVARTLAQAGVSAIIANSRAPSSLAALVADIGGSISAGTREQAARCDLVIVAINWSKLPGALANLPPWNKRIVIDANNSIEAPLFQPADLKGRTSSEVFTEFVPGARVVKAFNHLSPEVLSGDPQAEGGRRVLFYSGDDPEAKAKVGGLITRMGFFGIDLGPLAVGARLAQFPGGVLPTLKLVRFT